jgi:hypothetical protein
MVLLFVVPRGSCLCQPDTVSTEADSFGRSLGPVRGHTVSESGGAVPCGLDRQYPALPAFGVFSDRLGG